MMMMIINRGYVSSCSILLLLARWFKAYEIVRQRRQEGIVQMVYRWLDQMVELEK